MRVLRFASDREVGVSKEQLVEAVQKAGVSAEAVARHLGKAPWAIKPEFWMRLDKRSVKNLRATLSP